MLGQFAIQLTGLAVIALLLALILRRWVCAVLLILLAATLSWPVVASRAQPATVANPARLTIMSANLWHSAKGHDRTVDVLMASNADIIGLLELTPDWRVPLEPLFAKYPHRVDCLEVGRRCQVMLLSKLPIEKTYSGRIWHATPAVAGGDLRWNGRTITVLATHLYRPLSDIDESEHGEDDPAYRAYLGGRLPRTRQAGQAGMFAMYLNGLPNDLVVMGDFNGAPWSSIQRAFRDRTGLSNQAGWDFTWPSRLYWPLRLPLDHVLARGHLVVTRFAAGPETDSDHLPVIAEVGWRD
jgi:endonuclease/exonuclease/phosphatase (EEP) superfamily protein YafD